MQEVRQIYREHGWPDDFRRDECRRVLREWNRTIDERMAQPGNRLREVTRKPPGQDDSLNDAEFEKDSEDEGNG